MKTATIIFIIVCSVFSIGSLIYVFIDLLYELLTKKRKKEEPKPEPAPVPVPVPVPEPVPVPVVVPVVIPPAPVIEPVEDIVAEDADEMITDEEALAEVVVEEETAPDGYKSFINIGDIDKHFEAGDLVTIEELKEKKLIPAKTKRIKILADGHLTKPLTIKANYYSVQAIKMIELTGGTVIMLKTIREKIPPKRSR